MDFISCEKTLRSEIESDLHKANMRNYPSTVQIYTGNHIHSFVIRALVHLKDEISFAELRYAVDTAIRRYPYLAQKIVHDSDERDLLFLPNDAPICIFHDLGEHILSSEETNYHIQCVSYDGNAICFDISHGFADGEVLTEWVKTVLYYYLTKKHNIELDSTYIKTVEDSIPEEEFLDPLKPYVDDLMNQAQAFDAPPPPSDPPARISDFYPSTPAQQNVTFWVDAKDFIGFAKTNDGSPATFVIALIAKILHEKNKSLKAPLFCETVLNLKEAIHAKNSHFPIISPIRIAYPAKVLDHDLETLTIMMRGKVFSSQYDANAIIQNVAKMSASILSLPTIQEKKQVSIAAVDNARSANTFVVSYTGRVPFGALEQYIDTFYFLVSNDPSDLMVEISSVGNKLCFSLMQTFREDTLAKDIVSCFEENGVSVKDYSSQPLKYPRLSI